MTRRAGICIPLFSLRSTRSWGIGEIGDIPVFGRWLAAASQSVLQLLPINETAPHETSPYSPLSAMAIDPQYISIWMLDDGAVFEEIAAAELGPLRVSPRIAYRGVRELKRRALRASFDRFHQTQWLVGTGEADSLRAFIAGEGWWLDEYSLYRSLRAQAGERPWTQWREPLRERDPVALAKARGELATEILFWQYLQWIAARQWKDARAVAGNRVEILGDFPFMVAFDSADVWSRQREFILDASVGTPPDDFSASGQQWGLPPHDWDVARTNDFEWVRMRARRFAELFDGFRVDHLVGFYRTYVRPLNGSTPYFLPGSEDAQRQLGETLMRIMTGTGADITAEDLGTVPDFVRASIAGMGVPGYKVLLWEPGDPSLFPPQSVAMTGTHDMEPIAALWRSLTTEERRRYGSESADFDASVRDRVLERVYRAGSDLVLLPLQDAFGWSDRINQPATVGPANWTYALPWPVDDLSSGPEPRDAAARLARLGDQTGRSVPDVEVSD